MGIKSGGQILACTEFIDDALCSERLAAELDLAGVSLEAMQADQALELRLNVAGIDHPLQDPRVPTLVIRARRYRRCDAVAVFSSNSTWRMVLATGHEAVYLSSPALGGLELTSHPIAVGEIEALAAESGILGDLFDRAAAA